MRERVPRGERAGERRDGRRGAEAPHERRRAGREDAQVEGERDVEEAKRHVARQQVYDRVERIERGGRAVADEREAAPQKVAPLRYASREPGVERRHSLAEEDAAGVERERPRRGRAPHRDAGRRRGKAADERGNGGGERPRAGVAHRATVARRT